MAIEEHLRTCWERKCHMFLFIKILQEKKLVKKSYEYYFIYKFTPLLNEKN